MTEERGKAEIRDLAAEAGSLTEFAFRQIRADIIAGRFPSGIKLQIEDLKARYGRSEEHTSELQSLTRISYAVFCLKKKKKKKNKQHKGNKNRTGQKS